MIFGSRLEPAVAAMSIEWSMSANSTVTCLYSADGLTCVTTGTRSWQNLEFSGSCVPDGPHDSRVGFSAPRTTSTPIWCHCWPTVSVRSPSRR